MDYLGMNLRWYVDYFQKRLVTKYGNSICYLKDNVHPDQ